MASQRAAHDNGAGCALILLVIALWCIADRALDMYESRHPVPASTP